MASASAGGLSTAYSSLFSSGLDTAGRLPLAISRDFSGYYTPRAHNGFPKDFPTYVDAPRPSADTDSTNSRRSSLPTFSPGQSERRYGANGSYYATGPIRSTPVLVRSDTNATKRSHLTSFLSMDANDNAQASPPSSSLRSNTVPGYGPPQASKLTRATSVSSSARAPSMSPSPHFNHVTPVSNGIPKNTEDVTRVSPSLYEEPINNTDRRTYSVVSDEPPRLDVRLDPLSTRISFYPSSHGNDEPEHYADARKSSITDPHSIPPRPDYEPRVRSSLQTSSIVFPPPPIPARSIQRNRSVTSVSTFKSITPSQRSAIKRSRRNDALARLEGNFYDPAPYIQANDSFMPFASDDEEDDADKSANAMLRRLVISPAQSSSPPPLIKPPSPLRVRDREQRKFLEIGRLDTLVLDTIAEAAFLASPSRSDSEFNAARARPDDPPSIVVHSSMWPPFGEEEEEEPLATALVQTSTMPKATYESSPLGSRTNLMLHSPNHSSTSLSSLTPFAETDVMGPRNRTKSNASYSPAHKPVSGSGSITTMGSNSRGSHDVASTESFGSRDLGVALMESRAPRSKKSAQNTPFGSTSSFGNEVQRSPWIQGISAPPTKTMNAPKHKEQASSKVKEPKAKKRPARYETWLDMGADENTAKDASKKRRWLFGK